MSRARFPILLLAGSFYSLLVFLIPGFWVVRRAAELCGSWGWGDPIRCLHILHALLYVAIAAGLCGYVRIHSRALEDSAANPRWVDVLLGWLTLRGYRWLAALGLVILPTALGTGLYYGTLVPESFPLAAAVFLALADLSTHPVPVSWEDGLPPARSALDTLPDPGGEEGYRDLEISWNPLQWNEEGHPPRTEIFPISDKENAEAIARTRSGDLSLYVREGLVSSVLRTARRVREISEESRFNAMQELASVVALTRALPYATDEETHDMTEYHDYPVEFLHDGRGDCEDHAILAGALLHALGHPVGLFLIDLKTGSHVALAYRTMNTQGVLSTTGPDGHEYFYVETVPTANHHAVGDIPDQFFVELKGMRILAL